MTIQKPKLPQSFESAGIKDGDDSFDMKQLKRELDSQGNQNSILMDDKANKSFITLHENISDRSTGATDEKLALKVLGPVYKKRYMDTNIMSIADALDDNLEFIKPELLQIISTQIKLEGGKECNDDEKGDNVLVEEADPTLAHQSSFIAVGRVCVNLAESSAKFTLEPSRSSVSHSANSTNWSRMPLELHCPHSLFPGQIVAVEGNNITGNQIDARKLIHGSYPRVSSVCYEQPQFSQKIIVASGPYTKKNNLRFEHLSQLLDQLKTQPVAPHALILLGPLLEDDHPVILSGKHPGSDILLQTKVYNPLQKFHLSSPNTMILILPSTRDLYYPHMTLPQPPPSGGPLPFITYLPNPAQFNLGGIDYAIANYDLLVAMAQSESNQGSPLSHCGPRLPRLANHMLLQQSLFPLFPVPDNCELDVAFDQLDKFRLTHLPNILITPSLLRPFAQVVGNNDVVAINPGRVTQGSEQPGFYAEIILHPMAPKIKKEDDTMDDNDETYLPDINPFVPEQQCRVSIVRL